jgi:hypothetical protein
MRRPSTKEIIIIKSRTNACSQPCSGIVGREQIGRGKHRGIFMQDGLKIVRAETNQKVRFSIYRYTEAVLSQYRMGGF